jgi:hypothetical protein
MEHGGEADPGPEMLGVGGNGDQRLGRGLEQDGVDRRLVLVGDVGDRRRQREDHTVVRHRQELGRAVGQPRLRRRALALGAMAVAAGVVGDAGVVAFLAARDMTGPGLDPGARPCGGARSPTSPSAGRGSDGRHQAGGVMTNCSSGLLTSRMVLVATWL